MDEHNKRDLIREMITKEKRKKSIKIVITKHEKINLSWNNIRWRAKDCISFPYQKQKHSLSVNHWNTVRVKNLELKLTCRRGVILVFSTISLQTENLVSTKRTPISKAYKNFSFWTNLSHVRCHCKTRWSDIRMKAFFMKFSSMVRKPKW